MALPPPFLDDVKLRAEGRIGRVGKKWLALDRLNPDQQGICSATLSSKVETAIWLRCITIIVAYPSAAIRSGPCCITSIVAPQMGQHQPRGFSDDRFPT